jgi:hypothetical protein
VLIGKMPAARMGDMTAHGGAIVKGEPTVLIGEAAGGGGGGSGGASSGAAAMSPQTGALRDAAASGRPFCEI